MVGFSLGSAARNEFIDIETDMLPKRIQIVRNTLYLLYSEKNST